MMEINKENGDNELIEKCNTLLINNLKKLSNKDLT